MLDWIQKNWILVACGAVVVLALCMAIWAVKGFADIRAEASRAAAMAIDMEGIISQPANERLIEAARTYNQKLQQQVGRAQQTVLAANKRKPLRDDVFPTPANVRAPYDFKEDYKRAIAQLSRDLRAGKAPTGDVVELYITELEEKYRNGSILPSGQMRIPKPPNLQPIRRRDLASSAGRATRDRRGGRGDRFGRGYEEQRGEDWDDYEREPRAVTPRVTRRRIPAISGVKPLQPVQVGPTREQIEQEARHRAIYKTAKGIWTYVDDGSFYVHPLAVSDETPSPVHMWSAQVMLWIEQDIVQALRRVNEAAAQALPEDQRWVAHLPVKHVVGLDISDYLNEGALSEAGRRINVTVLHNYSGLTAFGTRMRSYTSSSYGLFGRVDASFTKRTRNDLYDVVHFKLEIVVDPRELLVILNELCKQNFFTPLLVRYDAVDVLAAREAGYEYGPEPAVYATIVCEVLLFREIYEPLMPKEVKDLLSGRVKLERGRGDRWR